MSHRQTVGKFGDFESLASKELPSNSMAYKNIIMTFPCKEKKLEQKFYRS